MSGKSREFYFEEGKIKIVQKREQIRDNKNYSIVELMLLFLKKIFRITVILTMFPLMKKANLLKTYQSQMNGRKEDFQGS